MGDTIAEKEKQIGQLPQTGITSADWNISLGKETKDFFQALVHSSFESPINGLGQVAGRVSGVDLPKLELTGPVENPSVGSALGTVSGIVIDYFLLSKLAQGTLGNIGGNGAAGESLRAGIVGGAFTGLLQPSDPKSDSFWKDRLSNGAVGALTFATLAASMHGLNASGYFAPQAERSFLGSVSLGALSGAASGAVHSEANALLKEGKAFPDLSKFASEVGVFAFAGASSGAWDYAFNLIIQDASTAVKNPIPSSQLPQSRDAS